MKYLPLLLFCLALVGCTTDGFDKDTPPTKTHGLFTPKEWRTVKTTAYCHMEDGNPKNAIGGRLQSGHTRSASADWSRFPVGTRFRVTESGQDYVIDDYGKSMVGKDWIDLYVPSMREMRRWGSRKSEIEILSWGSYEKSLKILRPRAKSGYVRRMVHSLENKVS